MKGKYLAMIGGLMALTVTACALPPFGKVLATNYKIEKGSALKKADCSVCHVGKKTKLNPYGEDVKQALNGAKELTADILKKIEDKDSDKDGVSNLDEIKADKLPGDAKSKPDKK